MQLTPVRFPSHLQRPTDIEAFHDRFAEFAGIAQVRVGEVEDDRGIGAALPGSRSCAVPADR